MEPDVVSEICAIFMSRWRFQKFSESRRLTIDASASTLVAAWLTGLPDFVNLIRNGSSLSHHYINGFTRLTEDRMAYMAVTALSSRVAEGDQGELMKDN